MAHDLFISYSNKDKPIADGICANLEAAGIRCWIAPRDIAAGEDWPTAITTAISNSKVMVLVFSASSNSSADVSREIILAANHNLTIIPFKIENVEPEPGKQYYLARTHWLEAMNPPTKEQIQMLVGTVRVLVPVVGTDGVVQPAVIPGLSKPRQFTPVSHNTLPRKPRLQPALLIALLAVVVLASAGIWGLPHLKAWLVPTPTLTATPTPSPSPTLATTPTKLVSTPTPGPHFSLFKTLAGQTVGVNNLAFSPDGRILASGSSDATIILWDITSGEKLQTLMGHTGRVDSVAFQPGGGKLASSSNDGTIILWHTSGWDLIYKLVGHRGGVNSIAFSPDDRTLASGSNDSTIILWDTTTAAKLRTLFDHISFVNSVAFSPDGHTLASCGSSESTIFLNDVASGNRLQTLYVNNGSAKYVVFSPDGHTLASGLDDGSILLWDTANWTKLRSLSGGGLLVFSPDGRSLATAGGNTIVLWEASSDTWLQTLDSHTTEVKSIAFSFDGSILASGSADGTIQIWKLDIQ